MDLWHLAELSNAGIWTPHKLEQLGRADVEVELLWWQVKALMEQRADDPADAAVQMLKGVMQLDDFASRGPHTLGGFVPDALLGAATGGAGFGVKATSRLRNLLPDSPGRRPDEHPVPQADPPSVPRSVAPAQPARLEVPERYERLPVREADAGQRGAWNQDLYRPDADTVYRIDDRLLYATDELGRVERVDAELTYRTPEEVDVHRHEYQQGIAGGEHRLETDQGGHLIGASLGGPGEPINLVAMDALLNGTSSQRDTWGNLEGVWRTLLQREPPADIRVSIDVEYPGGSTRPEAFTVTYIVDGGQPIQREFEQ